MLPTRRNVPDIFKKNKKHRKKRRNFACCKKTRKKNNYKTPKLGNTFAKERKEMFFYLDKSIKKRKEKK